MKMGEHECGRCRHWLSIDDQRLRFLGCCEHPKHEGECRDRHDTCDDFERGGDA